MNRLIFLAILITLVLFCMIKGAGAEVPCPANLWQGLVAEDTAGNYQDYLVIASVVRNRLNAGMNHGLVALKRKNLDSFISREVAYAKTQGKDLKTLAEKAITEVFNGKDYAYGADHYEHTGVYPTPSFFKRMKIVKVLYPGTKREITLARAKQ